MLESCGTAQGKIRLVSTRKVHLCWLASILVGSSKHATGKQKPFTAVPMSSKNYWPGKIGPLVQ